MGKVNTDTTAIAYLKVKMKAYGVASENFFNDSKNVTDSTRDEVKRTIDMARNRCNELRREISNLERSINNNESDSSDNSKELEKKRTLLIKIEASADSLKRTWNIYREVVTQLRKLFDADNSGGDPGTDQIVTSLTKSLDKLQEYLSKTIGEKRGSSSANSHEAVIQAQNEENHANAVASMEELQRFTDEGRSLTEEEAEELML